MTENKEYMTVKPPEGYKLAGYGDEVNIGIIKIKWPESWEELEYVSGYYVNSSSLIKNADEACNDLSENIFATADQAAASKAQAQLTQLLAKYRDGWEPDWSDGDTKKHVIVRVRGELKDDYYYYTDRFLSFETEGQRDHFLKHHRDLIEQARPLMGG